MSTTHFARNPCEKAKLAPALEVRLYRVRQHSLRRMTRPKGASTLGSSQPQIWGNLAPVGSRRHLSIVIRVVGNAYARALTGSQRTAPKDAAAAAFGAKWRKQLAGANAAAAGPSGWSEAPHACRAPAGCCKSAGRSAAAENERNHTTSENRRRNPPNLAHRLTAPETAALRRERRSDVREDESAADRRTPSPNARGSHTGR